MSIIDTLKDAVKLAAQVTQVGKDVDRIAKEAREYNKDLWAEIRELRERVLKLENFFEFAQKAGMLKLPK